jgi:hypothetical protein
MNRIYVLQHVAREDHSDEDVKLIGIYSTENSAARAVNRLKDQPGFRDYPDGFKTDPYDVDKDHWAEGFASA